MPPTTKPSSLQSNWKASPKIEFQRHKSLHLFAHAGTPGADEVRDTGVASRIAAGLDLHKDKASKIPGPFLSRHVDHKQVSFRSVAMSALQNLVFIGENMTRQRFTAELGGSGMEPPVAYNQNTHSNAPEITDMLKLRFFSTPKVNRHDISSAMIRSNTVDCPAHDLKARA